MDLLPRDGARPGDIIMGSAQLGEGSRAGCEKEGCGGGKLKNPPQEGVTEARTCQAGGVGEEVVTDAQQGPLVDRTHHRISKTPPCTSSPGRPRPPSAPTLTPTGPLHPSRRSIRTHLCGPGRPTNL